jgi:predicted nucleotidyltransferase
MPPDQILSQIRRRLAEVFGDRLKGVVLYGSEARGEAEPESDIDLMVLLTGPVAFGKDLEAIVRALYPVQLETDRLIDAWPADVKAYEEQVFSIYRRARREGVLL